MSLNISKIIETTLRSKTRELAENMVRSNALLENMLQADPKVQAALAKAKDGKLEPGDMAALTPQARRTFVKRLFRQMVNR